MEKETKEAIIADLQQCLLQNEQIRRCIAAIQLNHHRQVIAPLGNILPALDASQALEQEIKNMIERAQQEL